MDAAMLMQFVMALASLLARYGPDRAAFEGGVWLMEQKGVVATIESLPEDRPSAIRNAPYSHRLREIRLLEALGKTAVEVGDEAGAMRMVNSLLQRAGQWQIEANELSFSQAIGAQNAAMDLIESLEPTNQPDLADRLADVAALDGSMRLVLDVNRVFHLEMMRYVLPRDGRTMKVAMELAGELPPAGVTRDQWQAEMDELARQVRWDPSDVMLGIGLLKLRPYLYGDSLAVANWIKRVQSLVGEVETVEQMKQRWPESTTSRLFGQANQSTDEDEADLLMGRALFCETFVGPTQGYMERYLELRQRRLRVADGLR